MKIDRNTSFYEAGTQARAKRAFVCVAAIVCGCVVLPTAALAQVEEIVVTAQKREENIQDVPVAITNISGQTLAENGVSDVTDLQALAPSLNITQGGAFRNSAVRVRGLGSDTFSVGVEPSVAVVLDGVNFARPGEAFEFLSDLERIEVLRGPQGTLFGKNASLGAINIITKAPNFDEFEANASVEVAGDSEVEVKGMVSGPVSDTFAFRFNSYFNRLDGQVTRLSDGESANDLQKYGGRAKLAWEPSDNFRALLAIDYSRRDSDCCVNPIREFNPDNNAAFQVLDPAFLGVTGSDENSIVNTNEPVFVDTEGQGFSLTLDYDIGDHTLTSITSRRAWDLRQLADRDNSPANLQRQAGSTDQDQTTSELRLTSPQGDLIDYVVGLYYYDARVVRGLRQTGFRDNQINTVNPDGSIDANPARFRDGFFDSSVDVQNIAAFGNVNLHATDRLTLNGGLRVLRESQDWAFIREALPPNFNNLGQGDLGPINDEFSDTDATGKLGFQYALTDSVNTYFSYSTGYKGAAFAAQNSLRAGQVANQPTDPETSSSFELGLKSLLFDNTLQFNVAVYRTDVEGFQAAAPDLVNGGQIIQNIGEVRLQGIEAEFILSPNEYVDITGGIVVTDNEVVSGRTGCYFGQTLAEGCDADGTQDLAGGRIQNAPDVKLNLSGRFEYPVFDDSTAFILANYTWQDDVLFSLNQDPRTVQEDYGIFDLTVGLNLPGDRVQVAAFARNLFDQQYVGTIASFGGNAGANGSLFNIIPRNFDRYFGARITLTY